MKMSDNPEDAVKEPITVKTIKHLIEFGSKPESTLSVEKTKEELQKELTEAKETISQVAIKALEDRRQELLAKFEGNQRVCDLLENAGDGVELDRIAEIAESLSPQGQGKTQSQDSHAGKIPAIPTYGSSGKTYASTEEMINSVYDDYERLTRLRSLGMQYDKGELAKVESMRDKLGESMIAGMRNRNRATRIDVWQCPRCSKILVSGETVCPCGKSRLGSSEDMPSMNDVFRKSLTRRG
jgi:vacuolar-type H+-ATPase subunit I/STV1